MVRSILPTFKLMALCAIFSTEIASAQDSVSHGAECVSSEQLKPTRTATGDYTEEALRKGVEGTVVVCLLLTSVEG